MRFVFVLLLFFGVCYSQDCRNVGGDACCLLPLNDYAYGTNLTGGRSACSYFHDPCVAAGGVSTFCICKHTDSYYAVHGVCSVVASSSSAVVVPPLPSSSSDNGVVGGSDNGGGGGSDIVLSAETVDSVIVAFNMGFQSGIVGFAPVVMLAFAILIAAYLFNYAVGRF